jgi:hypothetical protein
VSGHEVPAVLFLNCTRDIAIENLAAHLTMGSEDEVRDRGYIWKVRGHSMGPSNKIIELEVVKRMVGFSIGLWKVSDWRLWRSRPPPKQKKSLLVACVLAL